jgi:hypothetical protein
MVPRVTMMQSASTLHDWSYVDGSTVTQEGLVEPELPPEEEPELPPEVDPELLPEVDPELPPDDPLDPPLDEPLELPELEPEDPPDDPPSVVLPPHAAKGRATVAATRSAR